MPKDDVDDCEHVKIAVSFLMKVGQRKEYVTSAQGDLEKQNDGRSSSAKLWTKYAGKSLYMYKAKLYSTGNIFLCEMMIALLLFLCKKK